MTYKYNKINFKDLIVSDPKRYKITHNIDEEKEYTETVVVQESFGTIAQAGTLVNAENLNHMEDGISTAITAAKSSILPWDNEETYAKDKTASVTVDGSLKFFMSLKDNNIGKNPLLESSSEYWAEVDLGGNGYDWVGTLAQYNAAMEAGEIEADWICLVTDDNEFVSGAVIDDTTASTTKVYSSSKIESILGNLESILSEV